MAGVDQKTLAWGEVTFHHFAGEVEEDSAGAGDFLQNEALPAEEAGAEAFLPGDFEGDGFFRDQEGFLTADQRLTGGEGDRHDGARETGREGDVAGAICGEIGYEEAAAAEAAGQAGEEAAAGVGVHFDGVIHPAHAVGLAEDGFARHQVHRDGLHDRAGHLVLHAACSLGLDD